MPEERDLESWTLAQAGPLLHGLRLATLLAGYRQYVDRRGW
jgi:hypothetical protein